MELWFALKKPVVVKPTQTMVGIDTGNSYVESLSTVAFKRSGLFFIVYNILVSVGETVHHALECGGGTGIFLAVNSSTIIVIRGKRACVWGSIYLDKFGEEDKELK